MNTHRYSVRFSVATRVKWIVTAILVVAAYVVWTEYKGQGAELLPYLFLLACPLMHLFHHGHGSHAHHHQRREAADTEALPSASVPPVHTKPNEFNRL
ncbi:MULTISPECIES: DUF2933 domain-containing protein [Noviherbaspirillum]|jgi:hypothetical protein|uniref:DUF2933 domain-containing protein n=1 Tax=Noviherbaspirillum TaxID=1344552 RepID=UPI00124C2C4C|nr:MULTISPECIES: DUF2933 domain-containing protein [Noviherbaspirillum]